MRILMQSADANGGSGTPALIVEPVNSATPNKPPESLPSKFEKAVMDELNAVKKFVGFDGEAAATPALVEPTTTEIPDEGHADNCWCPMCLFAKDE